MRNIVKTLMIALSSPASSFVSPLIVKQTGKGFVPILNSDPTTHGEWSVHWATAKNRSISSLSQVNKQAKRKQMQAPGSSLSKGRIQETTKKVVNRTSNKRAQGPSTAIKNTSASRQTRLPEPTVIFSNNHLLVVNKPAGYHSQPNESIEQQKSKKCLLSKLKNDELGGGSSKNFLLPMHRLDQPCTGILLLAKTSKAGTRTGNAFRKHHVQKDYFCVVEGNLDEMMQRSEEIVNASDGRKMYKLSGVLKSVKHRDGARQTKSGPSVLFKPLHLSDNSSNVGDQRVCHLAWEHLLTLSKGVHLVRVVTDTGAKHQVRAMLSHLANSPVCGDLRYGASAPLPDMSVALHARSLHLPTVALGDMNLQNMRFIAPIPHTWAQFFSLTEKNIPAIDYKTHK